MKEPKFEKDLERLEQIVEALEEGGLSLDDSLKQFEEGIKLAQRCENALTAAEKRIELLTKAADGTIKTSPLDAPEEQENSEQETEVRSRKKSDNAAEEDGDDDKDDGELLF